METKAERRVCFHGWATCDFCKVHEGGRQEKAAPVPNCATCGRRRPKRAVKGQAASGGRCWPCTVRGFVALRLF